MLPTDLDRFKAACVYPGALDERAVKRELAAFLRALGGYRRIVRLRAGWLPEDDRPFNPEIEWILAECVKRNVAKPNLAARAFHPVLALVCRTARRLRATLDGRAFVGSDYDPHHPDARAACAARDGHSFDSFDYHPHHPNARVGRDASDAAVADAALAVLDGPARLVARANGTSTVAEFVARTNNATAIAALALDPDCPEHRALRRGSMWELSRTLCSLFKSGFGRGYEERWRPLFEAFVCGCWLLYWTDDTLYWVPKPTVHREPGTQRLHHETRAALESEIVNLYFWHGVMLPPFVIPRPDLITIARIDRETNAEVRRVLIERYRHGEDIHSAAAFIRDAGGERLDHDESYGTLWRRNIPADEPIVMIEVINRTPEPDGSFKRYWLRVPPGMRTAREAVAWTFNLRAERYTPEIET